MLACARTVQTRPRRPHRPGPDGDAPRGLRGQPRHGPAPFGVRCRCPSPLLANRGRAMLRGMCLFCKPFQSLLIHLAGEDRGADLIRSSGFRCTFVFGRSGSCRSQPGGSRSQPGSSRAGTRAPAPVVVSRGRRHREPAFRAGDVGSDRPPIRCFSCRVLGSSVVPSRGSSLTNPGIVSKYVRPRTRGGGTNIACGGGGPTGLSPDSPGEAPLEQVLTGIPSPKQPHARFSGHSAATWYRSGYVPGELPNWDRQLPVFTRVFTCDPGSSRTEPGSSRTGPGNRSRESSSSETALMGREAPELANPAGAPADGPRAP